MRGCGWLAIRVGRRKPAPAVRWHAHALAALLLAIGFACRAESPETLDGLIERDEAQSLILGLHVGNRILHEGIIAYQDGQTVLVPLLGLCDALGIPVAGSPIQGHAQGWFREESRRFLLDTQRRALYVDGTPREVEWRHIERHADDLYLPLELFAAWFGLPIQAQLNHARLWLENGDDLPAQQRRARHARWSQRSRLSSTVVEPGRIVRTTPGWIDWPTLDVNLGASVESSRSAYRANALASGDLLRSEANVSVAWQRDALGFSTTQTRLRLQRTPASENGWGWSAGDVLTPALPLLLSRIEGIGLSAGNLGEDNHGDGFVTELRGEALNGWDVELYRNQELIALQTVESDNRYVFKNVPLQTGLNLFRMVLYGPQGQRRERLYRLNVGAPLLREGERRWRTYALLPGRSLLPEKGRQDEARARERRDVLFGAGYRWAVGSRAAAGVEAVSAQLEDGMRRHYAALRWQGGVGDWWLDGVWLGEAKGGQAFRVAAQRSGTRSDGGAEYIRYSRFESPEHERANGAGQPLESLQARWNMRLSPRTPLSVEAERLRSRADSGELHEASALRLRLAQRLGSANLALSADRGLDSLRAPNTALGMLLSYRNTRLEVSAQASREFAPRPGLRQANVTAHWRLGDRMRLRAQLSRNASTRERDRFDIGLSWTRPRFSLQLNAGTGTEGDHRVSAGVFASFQRGPQGWRADARAATATSSAQARVFLDRNANGRFDAGDRPLPDVAIRAVANGATVTTDAEGRAWLSQLPANTYAHLRLQQESLDNPFWQPSAPTISLRAHAGARTLLDFPVVPTVEISGTVYLQHVGARTPASNVQLELRDTQGRIVRETRTAFDGTYLLDGLPPGDYALGMSAEQSARLALEPSEPRRFSLGSALESAIADWVLIPKSGP